MKTPFTSAAAIVAALCFSAISAHAQTWNFDTNDQGWLVHDLNGSGDYVDSISTYAVDYHSTGGNTGGFISGTDRSGGSFFLEAPTSDLGNYTVFNGGKLNFSLTTDQSVDFVDDSVVIFRGSASNLTIVTAITPLPNANWSNYSIDLNASNFHYGNLAGGVVSTSDFSAIMADLTDVSIDGEYHVGISETTGLDSVAFVRANVGSGAVPEPSTYGILGALTLAGATLLRRKSKAKSAV